MALQQVAGGCDDVQTCPGVFVEGDDVVVQGYEIGGDTRAQLTLAADETAVRLPRQLILDAARRLTEGV
ncbi:hypothetical protein [Frankia gtarii]|uniref:hypothetical protein n=1 Tax=Frankia gtarii TaxID=2950102 RepID=UPI0021C1FBBA|nr:hypothetical protein [Frankia gtarii]